jgi:hypothetical protein
MTILGELRHLWRNSSISFYWSLLAFGLWMIGLVVLALIVLGVIA